jgi:hypothetical protein
MKIRMLICQASVDFVRNRGDVLELPDDEAMALIEAGIAAPERGAIIENALAPVAPERADKRAAKPSV